MANKVLFKSATVVPSVKVNTKKWSETTNEAGGAAFSMPDKLALAQFAVTGTFSNVFYADAESQLAKVKELALKVDSAFVAKLAVYAHEKGNMKDVPAFLLAVLHSRGETALLESVFGRVISTFKMLANFVQIVRSGTTGRKSFGSATKRIIQNWLELKDALKVFNGSIGLSDPSVADIIKMVHPKGGEASKDAVYAYITEARGYEEKMGLLPKDIQLFEALKKGESDKIPNIPFRALTNVKLSVAQWQDIGRNMPFETLRQNLNMLERKGVFASEQYVEEIVAKLTDGEAIRKAKTFPYQLFSTYKHVEGLPVRLVNALQDAMEFATANVPSFNRKVVLGIDVSSSMHSPVTGSRAGIPASKIRCVDAASLLAACVLRNNPEARTIMFDTRGFDVQLNSRDSVVTNAQLIANFGGGGTDTSIPLAVMNKMGYKADLVIYVSDNESWAGGRFRHAQEWVQFKKNNPRAKLVNIDIQPYATTQVPDNKDVLNIGGFSDAIWPAIAEFVERKDGSSDFVSVIENSVEL